MKSHLQNKLVRWSLASCALGLLSAHAFGQCEQLGWSPLGDGITDSEQIHAIATFDDGSGPALYVGGEFNEAGGVPVNKIAKWDGKQWADVGGGVTGSLARVMALAVFDDGNGPQLYVGGRFDNAGPIATKQIARWDGSTWSAVPGASFLGGQVATFAVSPVPAKRRLYVGGSFMQTISPGVVSQSMTSWDGATWEEMDATSVTEIALFDDGSGSGVQVYVGGIFTSINGVAANRVAKWDGTSWSPLLSGVNGPVYALAVFDHGNGSALYAAGSFTSAGGSFANRCARWDGKNWSNAGMSAGNVEVIWDLAVHGDAAPQRLFAIGDFGGGSFDELRYVAERYGADWEPVSVLGARGTTMGIFNRAEGPSLVAAGKDVFSAGGNPVVRIAQWNLSRDCNGNRQADDCDLANGFTQDCNENGIPDECEAEHTYVLDNATPIGGYFLSGGGDFLWLNQFNVLPGAQMITHVALPWYYKTRIGLPVMVLVYDDPNNDGDPSDAVLLRATPAQNFAAITFTTPQPFAKVAIPPTFVGDIGESFFVGAMATPGPGEPLPVTEHSSGSQQRSWKRTAVEGAIDINAPANGGAIIQNPGNLLIRALALDCNGNGIWDECDIDSSVSLDVNKNDIPDECEPVPCPADIAAGDGIVDVNDLLELIGAWGACPPPCPADLNGDGLVDVNDLLFLIGAWGPCT